MVVSFLSKVPRLVTSDSVVVKSGHLADWHQVSLRFFGPVALTVHVPLAHDWVTRKPALRRAGHGA